MFVGNVTFLRQVCAQKSVGIWEMYNKFINFAIYYKHNIAVKA